MKFYITRRFEKSSRDYTEVVDYPNEFQLFKDMRRKFMLSHAKTIQIHTVPDSLSGYVFELFRDSDNSMLIRHKFNGSVLYILPF